MAENWNINGFYSKEEDKRREALRQKIEAEKKAFASCYLLVDNKLQIHIYDKILQKRYIFTTDSNIKPYIDILKAKGYYEYVPVTMEKQNKDENDIVYYLEYRCPFELCQPGATWQIITLHNLVVGVNLFKAEVNFESIVKCNDKRAILTKPKNKGGKYNYVIDHISNCKIGVPIMQQLVNDPYYIDLVTSGKNTPKLTEEEEKNYNNFCEILPKLAENYFIYQLVCVTPINTNHAQSNNEYSNLVFIKGNTNRLKSNIIDKHLGLYAGIQHDNNIFVITFYSQGSFEINNEKCHRFSVLYKLPTNEDYIEQIKLQAETLQQIYMQCEQAQAEAEEIFCNHNKQLTITCWKEIKQIYTKIIKGKEVLYIPDEEMNQDFVKMWLNKEVFFAPGDKRVKHTYIGTD